MFKTKENNIRKTYNQMYNANAFKSKLEPFKFIYNFFGVKGYSFVGDNLTSLKLTNKLYIIFICTVYCTGLLFRVRMHFVVFYTHGFSLFFLATLLLNFVMMASVTLNLISNTISKSVDFIEVEQNDPSN